MASSKNSEEYKKTEKLRKLLENKLINEYNNKFQIKHNWNLLYYTPELSLKDHDLISEKRKNLKSFETDLIIYENLNKPRIVIEIKLKNLNSHEAITYSAKATKHKLLCPYLQYGVIVISNENCLPKRLLLHGNNFDFAYLYNENNIDDLFENIIKPSIKTSVKLEQIQKVLFSKQSCNIKWYRNDFEYNSL